MEIGQQFLHSTRYASDMPDEPSDQQKGLPQPPLELPFDDSMPIINLPDPKTLVIPSIDLRTAIDQRHSIRLYLSLIHISEPTRLGMISYAVFCLKKKKKN